MPRLLLAVLIAAATSSAWSQDIVIGQSVALSGPDADIGRDQRDGALAVFARANASNALGRRINLVTLDNANNRQRAAENTQQLVNQQGALALFGYNSATNSLDALPLAQKARMLFLAPFSGAASLRDHPNVYTVRASYRQEAAKIVETKRTVGSTRAVVLHYDDDVGRANYESVAGAFADAGLPKPPAVAVKRNSPLREQEVEELLKSNPHYVFATTQHGAVGQYLKLSAERGNPVPVAALSFVNPDELLEGVGAAARGTVVAQVMPAPRGSKLVSAPVVKECADLLEAFNGAKLNYTSLESCMAAKVLVAALRKAGPNPTREGLLSAMAGLGRVDLDGHVLNYANGNRHGGQWVELTILARGNRYVQ